MSLIYQVESAPTKGTRAGRIYNILELEEHQVTVAIPGLKFGRFSITRERLLGVFREHTPKTFRWFHQRNNRF